MGDFRDFAKRISAKVTKVDNAINKAVVELALDIVSQVAPETPYKTGRASSNWLTSIGQPISFYKENPTSNQGPAESIAMARQVLSGYSGGVIHIVNNVPYIAELNAGTSRQAPALFVQSAILRATYKFRSHKLNL